MPVNGGWQTDQVSIPGAVSDNSPLTFTTTGSFSFALTDGFLYGDNYTVALSDYGNLIGTWTTIPGLTATPFVNNLGPYAAEFAPAWNDPGYSKIALESGAGQWSVSVTGDCGSGVCPAGFGYRVDAVPEPATWAMLLVGFGAMGVAIRSRRKVATAALA